MKFNPVSQKNLFSPTNKIKYPFFILSFVLLISAIILGYILFNPNKDGSKNLPGYTHLENTEDEAGGINSKFIKRRYFSISDRVQNTPFLIPGNQIMSMYVRINEYDGSLKNVFVVKYKGKKYVAAGTKFISPSPNNLRNSDYEFPLVKINFPFLNRKENITPYLHPLLVIKMLHILDIVDFKPRISDAMRDFKEQMKYKERGWSTTEKSPHMLGLAFDVSRYFGSERKSIENECESLSLFVFQHGGRRNNHIHIQDDKIWTNRDVAKNVFSASKMLSNEYCKNDNPFNVYENYDFPFTNLFLYPYEDSLFFGNNPLKSIYSFEFQLKRYGILRIEIRNCLGNLVADIYTGVFTKSVNKFFIDFYFLPPGIYYIKCYSGYQLLCGSMICIY